MKHALIRLTTTVVACCALIAGSMALPAGATTRQPIPTTDAIVVPGPDQVSHTANLLECPWLNGFLDGLTAGISGIGAMSGSAMSASAARSYAMLAVAPLAAAECVATGH